MGIRIAPKSTGPSLSSVFASVALLAGSQALGILTTPGPKAAKLEELEINTASELDLYPYLAGTNRTTPHLIWYGDFLTSEVKNDVGIDDILATAAIDALAGIIAGGGTPLSMPPTAVMGGVVGGVSGAIVAGLGALRTASFRYHMGRVYSIGHGRIDAVTEVIDDERTVGTGTSLNAGGTILLDDPEAWGGDHEQGGVFSLCDIVAGDTWPTQQPNPYLAALLGNVPAYSGKALFVERGPSGYTSADYESGLFAAGPQGAPAVRPRNLVVLRLPDLLGVPEFKAINDGKDANVIEVIYDWLTGRTRGMGYGARVAIDKIDLANFRAAAETIYDEGLGYSAEIRDNITTAQMLEDLCAFASAAVYETRAGQIKIKLIRRDYSVPSLTVFDESNIEKVEGYTPATHRDVPNEVRLEYFDRDNNFKSRSIIQQNDASVRMIGDVISKTIAIPGVGCGETASIIVARELSSCFPHDPVKLLVNSDADDVEFGDVVNWQYSKYRITQKIMRVLGVKRSDTETNKTELTCVEDVFGRGDAINALPGSSSWVTPAFQFDITRFDIPMVEFAGQGDLDQIHGEAGNFAVPMIQFSGAGSVSVVSDGSYTLPAIQFGGAGSVLITGDGNFSVP